MCPDPFGRVVIACGCVVSDFCCMWVCREQFLTCVGGHTHTCTHNLGFPDGFDDEEEEEEEEGEVSEERPPHFADF